MGPSLNGIYYPTSVAPELSLVYKGTPNKGVWLS